jgi:menaquinone-dependent protoporphyrinogen oxidase
MAERQVKTAGIFYATREGQTEKIARFVAESFKKRGFEAAVVNLANNASVPDFRKYSGVVLAGSVHAGKHESELVRFVKDNRDALESLPAAFLSVTLSEAGVERASATEAEHIRFKADVQKMLDAFYGETGWRPRRVQPVAGALLYTHYNFLVRFVMKRIARSAGAETDTSRDYEYTNWDALDQFVEHFAAEISKS